MAVFWKSVLHWVLGYLPYTPQVAWQVHRRRNSFGRYNLEKLRAALPDIATQAADLARGAPGGKRIHVMASIHYWVEYCSVLALSLAAQGHEVSLGFFPYADYRQATTRFNRRYQSHYTRLALEPARSILKITNLLDIPSNTPLPDELQAAVEKVSDFDTQYVLQVETIDEASDFYRMRLAYNERTARALLEWLGRERPDVLVFPNGVVIEYGVAYQVAHYLKIPLVTFEFNEKREQIWIAQDDEVVRQDTDALWQATGHLPFTREQKNRIEALEVARRSARTFGKTSRLWQDVPQQGQETVRAALSLDRRPVALMATNVLGDSLILGRAIFSRNMGDWVIRTIEHFIQHPEVQLVIRIHPGERLMKGPSIADLVEARWPELPEHIHLIGPREKINTYDIVGLAQLGLVYTTTTGLEMVLSGLPVVVAGSTHYRQRGFTIDPTTWEQYFQVIDRVLAQPGKARPTPKQVELAWSYAYRFFFVYPRPFPWKLGEFWKDYQLWPLERVLGAEGQMKFGATFRSLAGEPIEWTDWDSN